MFCFHPYLSNSFYLPSRNAVTGLSCWDFFHVTGDIEHQENAHMAVAAVPFIPVCHHPLRLQEVYTRGYRSSSTTQSTGCLHLRQPGDALAIFVSCQRSYLDGHQCNMCRCPESPATLSIYSARLVVESTHFCPFLKGLADIEVEIFVIRIFDQRDDVYSLKHIGDNAYTRLASSTTRNSSIYRRYLVLVHWISHC